MASVFILQRWEWDSTTLKECPRVIRIDQSGRVNVLDIRTGRRLL